MHTGNIYHTKMTKINITLFFTCITAGGRPDRHVSLLDNNETSSILSNNECDKCLDSDYDVIFDILNTTILSLTNPRKKSNRTLSQHSELTHLTTLMNTINIDLKNESPFQLEERPIPTNEKEDYTHTCIPAYGQNHTIIYISSLGTLLCLINIFLTLLVYYNNKKINDSKSCYYATESENSSDIKTNFLSSQISCN